MSHWNNKRMEEVCTIIAGQSPDSKYYNQDGAGIPFFQGKADFGSLYPTIRIYCSQPHKIAEKGDILLSVRAPVGPTNLAPCRVCIGRGLTAIRPNEELLTKFVLLFFRYYEAQLEQQGGGTTFKAITQATVKSIKIPVPSLDEQERIVAKIEELFSEFDKTEETLRLTQIQLDLYKQSVLKYAFTIESNSISLEQACIRIFDGPFGSHLKSSDYIADGIRVVRLENIKDGWFDTSKRSFVSESKYETIKSHTVISGDLIMSTFLSDKVKVCKLPADIPFAVNKADCVGIRLKKEFSADFIQYFLLSRYVYRQLINNVHGATRPRVNTTQIKEISIPTIPLEQQVAIATNIEAKLSICNNIEATIQQTQRQIESLRQSILKKAFEGKLV